MDNLNLLDLNMSVASASDGDDRYVIFNLAEGTFAVNCKYVVSIERPTKVTEMANAPMGVRGVGYYKDEAINIFDLRVIFGYPSHEHHVENEINLGGHAAEHEGWAAEMVQSGEADPAFMPDTLSCGLGKWLETYRTDNIAVKNLIKRIEPIHEKFHMYADRGEEFSSERQAEAEKIAQEFNAVKKDLADILNDLHDVLLKQAKENIIVLKVNEKKIGIIIDDAESVDTLDEIQNLPPAATATEFIKRLGFRRKDRTLDDKEKTILLIFEAEMLA